MRRFFFAFLLACSACGSSATLPEDTGVAARDAGSTACTTADASQPAQKDAAATAIDATEEPETSQSDTPLFAPWGSQQCWYGALAYQAVPPCEHGTYVVCFASEAGGAMAYCDDTVPTCHLMADGTYHCPAGTRTTNTACSLQPDEVVMWPSTYTYTCTVGTHP